MATDTKAKQSVCRIADWREIDGWFNESDARVYDIICANLHCKTGTIVEIGSWLGRSTGALIEAAWRADVDPEIHVVDTFRGSPNEPKHLEIAAKHGGSVLTQFIANIARYHYPITIQYGDSGAMSALYRDHSIEAAFIDASHEYLDTKRDIMHWLPKVKHDGILAGHDYHPMWPGVIQAVNDWFDKVVIVGYCWMVKVR